jgi:hypothetical protein
MGGIPAPAPEGQEVGKPPEVRRQPTEGRPNPHGGPLVPRGPEKFRDLLPGRVGNGPEAQKGHPPGCSQLRQGTGLQVQNRLGQPGQKLSLTSLVNDAAGGDHTGGDRGEPRLVQSTPEAKQCPGGSRRRDRPELPGVWGIAPESLPQDQVTGGQPRGQGPPEPQGDQELGAAAAHEGLPGPAGRSLAHPGQGHHGRARPPFPGWHPQVPANLPLYPAQKRPHLLGKRSHYEDSPGPGGD